MKLSTTPDEEVVVAEDAPAADRKGSAQRRERLIGIAAILVYLVLWQLASVLAGRTPNGDQSYIPSILDILGSFVSVGYYWTGGFGIPAAVDGGDPTFGSALLSLLQHSLATIGRLMAGFLSGAVLAIAAAAVVSASATVRRMLLMPAHVARMLPLMAMIPLFGIWFGNSEVGSFAFIAFGTFAIVFMSALTAIGGVPPYFEQYARSLGAGRVQAYITSLPAAIPSLRGGIMLALGFGWSMVIAAEYIGQNVGVGSIVLLAEMFGQTGTMAVLAFFVIVYAAIGHSFMNRLFARIIDWYE